MSIDLDTLVDEDGWIPMPLNQQDNPSYIWEDGRLLKDAPVDFAATFGESMWVTTKPIGLGVFNRNPLRVVPDFLVPRHSHNIDETVLILRGEYLIEFGDPKKPESFVAKAGSCFTSRAGTPYTMTAGPEGVTYIETWGVPVTKLKTFWMDYGWVHR